MSAYFPQSPYHQPQAYPVVYNSPPVVAHAYSAPSIHTAVPLTPTYSAPNIAMPTYYVSPSSSGRHRSRSQSHSHSYQQLPPQPQVYYSQGHSNYPQGSASYAYPQQANYSSGAYYDPNGYSRSRHHSTGQSGSYYDRPSSSHSHSGHRGYTSSSAHGHSSSHRRSHSSSRTHSRRQSTPHVIDLRNQPVYTTSGSHHGQSRSHSQRRYSSSEPSVGDRLRNLFGMSPNHRANYVDARTGRPVDWQGRPIYRV